MPCTVYIYKTCTVYVLYIYTKPSVGRVYASDIHTLSCIQLYQLILYDRPLCLGSFHSTSAQSAPATVTKHHPHSLGVANRTKQHHSSELYPTMSRNKSAPLPRTAELSEYCSGGNTELVVDGDIAAAGTHRRPVLVDKQFWV